MTLVLLYAAGWVAVLLLGVVIVGLVVRGDPEPAGVPRIDPPRPRRYAGCITCEAAEATSRDAMLRHQTRDHAGGVQW